MYICDKCGDLIEELPTEKETLGFFHDEPIEETIIVDSCDCGGTYEKAKLCDYCGEYGVADDFEFGMCKRCQQDVMERFEELLNVHFEPDEINYIYENWSV